MFGRPSPFKVALGRLLVFVSGSLGTLLLLFAAINDAILLHVKIGNWNLREFTKIGRSVVYFLHFSLMEAIIPNDRPFHSSTTNTTTVWYAGVLGASFSIGKGMLPKANSPYFGHARRNLLNDMNLELEKLATHTHFLPDAWRGKGWDDKTKKEFAPMFQFKANLFVHEILSIIAAPIILCVSLPRCAEKLCRFVRDSKVEVPGVGDVVGYATFDFDSFEDENWRGKGDLEKSSKISIRDSRGIRVNNRPKSRHGKMEKSFFNFKGVYPNWTMPPSGKNLVDKIESFRHQQDIALARERRLHIDAAAAQLETLRRLEMIREKRASAGLAGFVDNQHIRTVSSGPDSGGGGAPHGVNLSHHSNNEVLSELGSFGSYPNDGLHHPHAHFEESPHSFAPPSHAFGHASLSQHGENINEYSPHYDNPPVLQGSPMHFADPGLSMELRGLLNGSTLVDPSSSQQSFTGSLVPMEEAASILDIRSDQQVSI